MATIDSSNTLSVFIENQGYTLADIPLFFEDDRFRDFLVSNVKYTAPVADYWRHSFAKQKAREQNSKIDATLTRLYILLSREYVRSVVGQAQTTIDFASIMRDRKVVCKYSVLVQQLTVFDRRTAHQDQSFHTVCFRL